MNTTQNLKKVLIGPQVEAVEGSPPLVIPAIMPNPFMPKGSDIIGATFVLPGFPAIVIGHGYLGTPIFTVQGGGP
jgi:hypothetical protein